MDWMEPMLHALTITGFVAVMMLVIEYINVRTRGRWLSELPGGRMGQYAVAALLGALPGCLGAFAVVGMFTHGLLTRGALVAAMIATAGDESFVMLALIPETSLWLFPLLAVLGVGVGWLSDLFLGNGQLKPSEVCHELLIHPHEPVAAEWKLQDAFNWRACSAARALLAIALLLFVLAVAFGMIGPEEWNWVRFSVLGIGLCALYILLTVSEHFIQEHLWRHIVRRHVPRIFLWTLAALIVIHSALHLWDVSSAIATNQWWVLVSAGAIGLIPESGPHLLFVTLYAEDALPIGVLMTSAIVQDGHGMLPLLAHSWRMFIGVKLINLAAGLLIGAACLLWFQG